VHTFKPIALVVVAATYQHLVTLQQVAVALQKRMLLKILVVQPIAAQPALDADQAITVATMVQHGILATAMVMVPTILVGTKNYQQIMINEERVNPRFAGIFLEEV